MIVSRQPISMIFCDDALAEDYRVIVLKVAHDPLRIPVVASSRRDHWGHYLQAMRAGAFDYISSPIRRAEVERIVSGVLRSVSASF